MADDLTRCQHLADVADAITMKYYRSVNLGISTKPDKTPVTQGDIATSTALEKIVTEEFGDAYLSEEGDQTHQKGRQWIVDPIDGTKNFMRGVPLWATLISIQDDSGTLAAIITAPALGRRWWAAKGKGAWTKDVDGTVRAIRVSGVSNLADAFVTYSSLFAWDTLPSGSAGFLELLKTVWRERSPGDFFGHVLVAEGATDASVEPDTKEWDMAAHAFIVTEAGGSVYTHPMPGMNTPASRPRIVITSNGKIEQQIRQVLRV